MTEVQRLVKIKLLKELLQEYELRAKYNTESRDYDLYSALDWAVEALGQTPKMGYWEETRYRSYDPQSCETYDDGVGFRCSNCANVFKVTSLARYHYCPNCGAKMSEIPTGSEIEG